jgi:FAD/FMN-containing dehydrogenase
MQSEREGEKYWVMRRESFNLLRQKVKDKTATPFVDDFAVQPQYLSEFLPQLYKLLEKHGIQPTLAGHVGDGNFHIIPLMDLKKSSELVDLIIC